MEETNKNTERIAKNTLLLYFRLLVTMGISLYTSRIVLTTLGVSDYGIYNVVGGFVSMFSMLSGSISGAISRFLTFELGRGDINKLKKIFSTSVTIQVIMSIVVIVLGEVIGVWFLNNMMDIPSGRLPAANWVLQLSILSFCINLVSSPYNAAIIAHERMDVFAYISVLEAALKFLVAFLLTVSPIDSLIFYSFLLVLVNLSLRLLYGLFCKSKFEECKFHLVFDGQLIKEMFSFAGWTFLGNSAYVLNTHGVNMLINLFFGVTVNAARGIVTQIDGAIRQFANGFTTAVNPQITKSYAAGDIKYFNMLICRSSKLSGYLLLLLAVPIILEADEILHIWLVDVPEYSSTFLRLTMINVFCDTGLSSSLLTAVMATGKVKKYQIVVTMTGIIVFPITWLLFKLGASPSAAYYVYGVVYFVLIFVRLVILRELVDFSPIMFIKTALIPFILVAFIAFLFPYILTRIMEASVLRLLIVFITSIIATTSIILLGGLTKSERHYLRKLFLRK